MTPAGDSPVPMSPPFSLLAGMVKGGVWAFFGKLFVALAALAANALLARMLTTEEFGGYFLLLSFATFAALIAQFGLPQATIRLVGAAITIGCVGEARSALGTAFLSTAVTSCLVVLTVLFGVGEWVGVQLFHSQVFVDWVPLAGAWVVLLAFQALIGESCRAFDDVPSATLFGGLVGDISGVALLSTAWLLSGTITLAQAILLVLAGLAVSVLAGLLRLSWLYRGLRTDTPFQVKLKSTLPLAGPLLVTNLTYFVVTNFDVWLLGYFRTDSEVALYGAAARMAALIGFPLLIVSALTPQIIAAMYAKGERRKLEAILRTTTTLIALPSLLALPLLFIFGETLLGLLFGDLYRQGYHVALVLGGAQLLNVLSGPCGVFLNMTGHHRAAMNITILCSFIAIGLALWAVPRHGMNGAAAAAAVGLTLQNAITAFYAWHRTGIKTYAGFGTGIEMMKSLGGKLC